MNEPPGARARVALTGLTVAEYFRDQEGQDVLLFIDNIFRYFFTLVCLFDADVFLKARLKYFGIISHLYLMSIKNQNIFNIIKECLYWLN